MVKQWLYIWYLITVYECLLCQFQDTLLNWDHLRYTQVIPHMLLKQKHLGHEVTLFYIALNCNHAGHVEVILYILQNGYHFGHLQIMFYLLCNWNYLRHKEVMLYILHNTIYPILTAIIIFTLQLTLCPKNIISKTVPLNYLVWADTCPFVCALLWACYKPHMVPMPPNLWTQKALLRPRHAGANCWEAAGLLFLAGKIPVPKIVL